MSLSARGSKQGSVPVKQSATWARHCSGFWGRRAAKAAALRKNQGTTENTECTESSVNPIRCSRCIRWFPGFSPSHSRPRSVGLRVALAGPNRPASPDARTHLHPHTSIRYTPNLCRLRTLPGRFGNNRRLTLFEFGPGVAQGDGAVEYRSLGAAVAIRGEVAEAFELDRIAGLEIAEGGFQVGVVEDFK
jgi:hypothetical protein